MHKCIKDILNQLKEHPTKTLLIDGNYFNPYVTFNKDTNKFVSLDHVCVKGGDNKYSSIAAASILAKVARDEYIEDLCLLHPDLVEKYSIDSNKGYGSKAHIEGIRQHGITKWHRKTFGICKEKIESI
jgi:ribonuclease HII